MSQINVDTIAPATTGGIVNLKPCTFAMAQGSAQSLANNTLNYESIFKKLFKELLVALFNGFICASIALIFCWITRSDFYLALTIGVSLVAVFTYAGLFGTFVPLILNKYKIDPALATGPFITTTNDIIGLLIYFLIGMALYF